MDVQFYVSQLRAERPDLIPALQRLTAKGDPSGDLNTLLAHLLQMQERIDQKRKRAASLVVERFHVEGSYHTMRHIPDVVLRAVCEIAEMERKTLAREEWLDEMEAKHA